jgi:hypothetical protein
MISSSSSGINRRRFTLAETRRYALEWRDNPNPVLRGLAVLLAASLEKGGGEGMKIVIGTCTKHGDQASSLEGHCPVCDAEKAAGALDPKAAHGALKAPLWLVPPAAEEELAKALALGAGKYGEWNWRRVKVKRSVYLSAMKRHIGRILDGEDIDPESLAHHLGHVMANCAIILDAAWHAGD